MKKTYFCASDIHGFFDYFKEALIKAGFDEDNPDHILIVVGDIFDRGRQALEVYNFLKSLPRERRILIRGNHELLLRDLVHRGFPYDYDYSNGTYNTLFQLAETGVTSEDEFNHKYYRELAKAGAHYGDEKYREIQLKYQNIRKKLYKGKVLEVLEWIASDEWVNYYELDNYIFVHSWIPVGSTDGLPAYYLKDRHFFYREDWKNATQVEWEDSTWGCPWMMYQLGLLEPELKKGKTLVCGHWHAFDVRAHLEGITHYKSGIDYSTYIGKGLIALDTCTVRSKSVNIYKIEKED